MIIHTLGFVCKQKRAWKEKMLKRFFCGFHFRNLRGYCKDTSNFIEEQYFPNLQEKRIQNHIEVFEENTELQALDLLEESKEFNFIDEQYFKGEYCEQL